MTETLPTAVVSGAVIAYPDATVPDLIMEQAARRPDQVAVRQWDDQLTYRQLVEQAAGIAAALRAHGVGPETRVGICSDRRPTYVATVLGVLMSGGCYVPLEPGGPRQRALEIIADAGISVVVGDSAEAEFGDVPGIQTVGPMPATTPIACPAIPDNTAHVLFTSGSTGRPKGVLTTHRNIMAFVAGYAAAMDANESTRALGVSSLGFDATTIDLFIPLIQGGSIQLVGTRDRSDPTRLQRFIAEHEVNWGFITPTMLSVLEPEGLPGWQMVMCGGEAVPAALATRWAAGRRFVDVYGPTESTVLVVSDEVTGTPEDPLPIGLPLPNHRAYVMDADLRPVAPGEVGELLIGGPGLAPGYLNRPGLTADRFVPDAYTGLPGQRLYRTGDLVRQLPDGRIIYLGRGDRQVKIRGQRIELGEIETVLSEHPQVQQAAVEAVPGAFGKELVAFLTPATAPDEAEIRAYTQARLTSGMQPARVLRLAELPTSLISGKLDRAALRALAMESTTPADDWDDPDASPIQRAVVRLWRQLLGATPGADTDFFLAGGNSIAVMRLVAALRAELKREISADDVFAGRRLAELVDRITNAAPLTTAQEFTTGNPPTLSPPQRRLWFMDQLAPSSAPYNIALATRLRGDLDIAAFGRALRSVAERHDVLRWRVPQTAGVPYAVCEEPSDIPVPVVDLTGSADQDAELRTMLAAGAGHTFDLATGPAWQVTVYRLGQQDHVLAITLHHAVFDGWSQDILYTDLAEAYQAASSDAAVALPALRASYADYAVWRADRDQRQGQADLDWWVAHLAGAPTVLDLPRDRPRPAVQTYAGAETSAMLPAPTDQAVRQLAARLGATPAGVLLAGFGQLLNRLTGADDHVIGAIVADRQLAAFDDVIGFFIDTVPVRLRTGDASFEELVRRAAAELRDSTAHPGAPLERVVEALGVGRDTSRAPLVQVLFNVLNFTDPQLRLSGLDSETVTVEKPGSPFDITLYVVERAGRIGFDVVYNPDLFDADRIDGMLGDLVELTGALTMAPGERAAAVAPHLPSAAVRQARPEAMTTIVAPEPIRLAVPTGSDELTRTEQLISAVWRDVLEHARFGVTDNFFDIGGHSLALAAVHARLTAETGRTIVMLDLFRYPTIRALAAHLDGATERPELTRAVERAAARRGRTRRNPPRRASGIAE
ncbi:amino acid adenylation domain-containing protein [Micromonospora sp. NPDC003197]